MVSLETMYSLIILLSCFWMDYRVWYFQNKQVGLYRVCWNVLLGVYPLSWNTHPFNQKFLCTNRIRWDHVLKVTYMASHRVSYGNCFSLVDFITLPCLCFLRTASSIVIKLLLTSHHIPQLDLRWCLFPLKIEFKKVSGRAFSCLFISMCGLIHIVEWCVLL